MESSAKKTPISAKRAFSLPKGLISHSTTRFYLDKQDHVLREN